MKPSLKLFLTAFLFILSTGIITHAEDFTSIEGMYVLESRKLTDGTILTPPDAVGLYTLVDGHVNFNVASKHKDGTIHSRSMVGTYEISGSTYSVDVHYIAENDGTGIKYDFSKRSGLAEMTMSDGKIKLLFPLSETFYGTFGPDSLTVDRGGQFVDNWVKVK